MVDPLAVRPALEHLVDRRWEAICVDGGEEALDLVLYGAEEAAF